MRKKKRILNRDNYYHSSFNDIIENTQNKANKSIRIPVKSKERKEETRKTEDLSKDIVYGNDDGSSS
jgi:hypothetical protein